MAAQARMSGAATSTRISGWVTNAMAPVTRPAGLEEPDKRIRRKASLEQFASRIAVVQALGHVLARLPVDRGGGLGHTLKRGALAENLDKMVRSGWRQSRGVTWTR
jgi:hypothetical protein